MEVVKEDNIEEKNSIPQPEEQAQEKTPAQSPEEVLKHLHKTEHELDLWAQREKGYNSYAEWYNDLEY